MANPVPFLVDPGARRERHLRAHVARANPQWRELARSANASSSSRARRTTSRRPGMRPSARPARSCRPGITRPCMPGATARDRRCGLAAPADRGSDPLAGMRRAAPWHVGTRRRISSRRRSGHRRHRNRRSPGSRASGRSARTGPIADREGVVAGLRAQGDEASLAMAALVEARLRE